MSNAMSSFPMNAETHIAWASSANEYYMPAPCEFIVLRCGERTTTIPIDGHGCVQSLVLRSTNSFISSMLTHHSDTQRSPLA
jgi:hypothetical protein